MMLCTDFSLYETAFLCVKAGNIPIMRCFMRITKYACLLGITGTMFLNASTSFAQENVSIDNISTSGLKSYERLSKFCTEPTKAKGLNAYDEKIQELVRVVLGFKRVCIDDKSCAYY